MGSHGTTFGGNPVACAAAIAVMEAMEGLLPHAASLSARAFERFRKAQATYSTIGDVRGLGLMIGVELVKDRETRDPDPAAMDQVARHGLANELILIPCGPDGNIIRFIPPLVTTIGRARPGDRRDRGGACRLRARDQSTTPRSTCPKGRGRTA